jgi:hypothetical protein
MSRDFACFTVIAAIALGTLPVRGEDLPPPCRSRAVNVERVSNALKTDVPDGSLCLQGSATALHLEVHQTKVATVLSALANVYKLSVRSSSDLSEARDGVYAGSLERVISRLLVGYNYVIKHENSGLDIAVFDKKGEQAIVAPVVTLASQNAERAPAQVSRNH